MCMTLTFHYVGQVLRTVDPWEQSTIAETMVAKSMETQIHVPILTPNIPSLVILSIALNKNESGIPKSALLPFHGYVTKFRAAFLPRQDIAGAD